MRTPPPLPDSADGEPAIQSVDIDEPIGVTVASYRSASELQAILGRSDARLAGNRTVLIALNQMVRPGDVPGLLGKTSFIHRLVLTEDRPAPAATVPAPALTRIAQAVGAQVAYYEPDAQQAVVGSMQYLNAGDSFLAVWPSTTDMPLTLIRLAARWRCGLEQAEEDGYFSLPIEMPT